MSFAKVFESILGSTVWLEDDPTRIVWLTMLLRADQDGIVEGSLPGLAHLARVTPAQCAIALQKFLSPDEYSRTKDFEGRRIREVAGGWEIINHAMYRAKASPEEVRAKSAERQRLRRRRLSRKADDVTPCHAPSRDVAQCHDIAEAEAEAEAEAAADHSRVQEHVLEPADPPPLPAGISRRRSGSAIGRMEIRGALDRIASGLERGVANATNPVTEVEIAQAATLLELSMPPRFRSGPPDEAITRKILAAAGGIDGLRAMLKKLAKRQVDARNYAFFLHVAKAEGEH
jgi:hypothetical protein